MRIVLTHSIWQPFYSVTRVTERAGISKKKKKKSLFKDGWFNPALTLWDSCHRKFGLGVILPYFLPHHIHVCSPVELTPLLSLWHSLYLTASSLPTPSLPSSPDVNSMITVILSLLLGLFGGRMKQESGFFYKARNRAMEQFILSLR